MGPALASETGVAADQRGGKMGTTATANGAGALGVLRKSGLTPYLAGDGRLMIHPVGKLTDDHRSFISANRTALVAGLKAEARKVEQDRQDEADRLNFDILNCCDSVTAPTEVIVKALTAGHKLPLTAARWWLKRLCDMADELDALAAVLEGQAA
jgi:hypothetical protein